MNSHRRSLAKAALVAPLAVLLFGSALADDAELYVATASAGSTTANVLLIFDNSAAVLDPAMPPEETSASGKYRFAMTQEAVIAFLEGLHDVNIGLMVHNASQGGRIIAPIGSIERRRASLQSLVADLKPDGGSPLSETLYEAYNYFAGLPPRYQGSAEEALSASDSFDSPVGKDSCSKNYVVYISGSTPLEDTDINLLVPQLPGFTGTDPANPRQCSREKNEELDGSCLDDLAKYLHDADLNPDNSIRDNVTTYAISLDNLAAAGMRLVAEAGGGDFSEANDQQTLTEALAGIVNNLTGSSTSFSVPVVGASAFARIESENNLFVAVFNASNTAKWAGNLKKYGLRYDGTILDANSEPAIQKTTGTFDPFSSSYWSSVVDGQDVKLGGAASLLPAPDLRRVYTDLAPASAPTTKLAESIDNQVVAGNPLLTAAALGVATLSASERDVLVQWIRGGNVDMGNPSAARLEMGDSFHSRPAYVRYGDTDDADIVYVATNDGYLHSFDANTGREQWAFVPGSMLKRMPLLRGNNPSVAKSYGLDGNLVVARLDTGKAALTPDRIPRERILLFFGMGRGGSDYYALDITSQNSPELLWRKGPDNGLTGIGQTWSTPTVTRMDIAGAVQNENKIVVVVGGGYDPGQDAADYGTDERGNRLFILDAVSGDVLWNAGPAGNAVDEAVADTDFQHPKMTHSIPADLRVLDLTGDGFADRMYAADTGGRIWRFDIHNGKDRTRLVTGGVLASLGNADSPDHPKTSNRRFYAAPDVSLLGINGRTVANIAIGSGYRGHPLDTETQDRFYAIRDPQPFISMQSQDYLDMIPITDDQLSDVTTEIAPVMPPGAHGWKILLNQPAWQGEKVLSESRTFDGSILFTTFTPERSSGDKSAAACRIAGSKNALFAVNAKNGSPVFNHDGTTPPDETSDRRFDLLQGGIAPVPLIVPPPAEGPSGCQGEDCHPPPLCLVGLEQCGGALKSDPVRTFWTQQTSDDD